MKAAIVEQLGQSPVIGNWAEPEVNGDEQLVTVRAAGIKQLDRAIVAGKHYSSPKTLPIIPGTDGVGLLADGSRVYFAAFRPPFGAMAERSIASWSVPVPDGLDDAQAAALINPALAAWLPLFWRADMQPGETVLILGATGTSGRLAMAAARLAGAGRIVAAGRRQSMLDTLGADATVNLSLPDDELRAAFAAAAGPEGYDVIIDYIWGAPTEALLATMSGHNLDSRAAGRGVRLVNVGSMASPDITLPAGVLRSGNLHILGSGTGNFPPVADLKPIVADILARAARGEISVEVQTHPFADISQVWDINKNSDLRSVLLLAPEAHLQAAAGGVAA